MAVAFSPSAITVKPAARSNAGTIGAKWTGVSALIAAIVTIPLAAMLANPLSSLMFVRGSAHDGDWLRVIIVVMIPLSPAMYAMFWTTAGELLKNRVSDRVRTQTMRVAGLGLLPYVLIAGAGYATSTLTLQVLGMLTIPMGMAATIWASTKNH